MNWEFVFVAKRDLILRVKISETELRMDRRTTGKTKQMAGRRPHSGGLLVLLATTKLGMKSAFWVLRGRSMHGPDRG